MRPTDITAVILCGGTGRRLGTIDKPMQRVHGRPLVGYVLDALRPQVGGFVVSCGRDATAYETLGHPVAADEWPGEGPLGGIASALRLVETDWLLSYPGDAPFADPGLVERLTPVAEANGVAVPRAGERRQNLILLISRERAADLARFYRDGGRAVKDWLDSEGVTSVDMTDTADSFFNVNTPADLVASERRLSEGGQGTGLV